MDEGARTAAGRQAAALFMAAGAITLLELPLRTHITGVALALAMVGGAGVAVGAATWFLPWHRWPERALLAPALGALGLIWAGNAFGDPDPYTYSIYFVVLFAWLGLNQPRGTALLAALPMAAAYLAPLFTTNHDPDSWPTVFVTVPVCVLLGETISRSVARLRTSRELDMRRVGDLEAIVSAGALLQAETSPQQLGPLLARVATSVFHAREAVVVLQDHADGRIVAGTHSGDSDSVAAFPALDAVEEALREGQPVRQADTLVVPLRGVSRILGAVALRFAPDTTVDTFAIHAAQLFGSQAGIALEQQRAIDELTEAAMQDPLTLVGNRRRASVLLEALQPTDAVVLIDLDQFKHVNDTAGHAAGDRVLVSLAQYLRGSARDADAIARYGGEEFLLVLRGAGDAAMAAMQRLLEGWRALRPLTTFSAGVAVHQAGRSPAATLGRADAALYRAKNAGRDRVFEDAIGETV